MFTKPVSMKNALKRLEELMIIVELHDSGNEMQTVLKSNNYMTIISTATNYKLYCIYPTDHFYIIPVFKFDCNEIIHLLVILNHAFSDLKYEEQINVWLELS
jgi:hypothetical protein